MIRANELWRQQQLARAEGDREPLIVKEVEQDGKVVLVVAGQSTLPQTIFNSTNVLIGVGLLSLPMGIKYAGWLLGMVLLLFSALVTAYTARLLAKCMDVDASLITFADLAFVSYGQKARIATSVLFTMELLAACVALVVLFADTLDLLIPGVGVTEWKVICGLLMIPLNFAPLRLLSFSSVVGIFSCFSSKLDSDSQVFSKDFYLLLTTSSCYHRFRRRVHKTPYPRLLTGTSYYIPLPLKLAHPPALFRPPDVTLGRAFRFPKYIPRHATPLQIQTRRQSNLHFHRKPIPHSQPQLFI